MYILMCVCICICSTKNCVGFYLNKLKKYLLSHVGLESHNSLQVSRLVIE